MGLEAVSTRTGLDLNISIRLSDYCSVFRAEVMAIYRAIKWTRTNGASFTRVSAFSDCQAVIRTLPGFMNNCRRFTSVSLAWVSGHSDIPVNCITDELARSGALLPESSSIELGMTLALIKLNIER